MTTIIFNPDGTRTVTDTRTLADAQAGRIAALQAELAAEIAKGITHAGKPLQIDEAAQARIAAVVTRINAGVPLPPGFAWRMADNSFLPVTAPQMIGLATAAADRVMALRVAYWAAADAVRATTTREAADAVRAVWP